MKILIVDDDTAIRIIVKYLVKRAGFRDHEFAGRSRAGLFSVQVSAKLPGYMERFDHGHLLR